MPFDAIFLRAVLNELPLVGARVDKVQQPSRNQIILALHGHDRVLLSANPNQPRIQFTREVRDNPTQPPMFCMLLRKHLVGARIESLEQPDMERVVRLNFRIMDEPEDTGRRSLVLEAVSRRANLILLNAEDRILDSLRRVTPRNDGDRALLPGQSYQLPAPLNRLSLLTQADEALALLACGGAAEEPLARWLVEHFSGISPLIARELAQRAAGATDVRCGDLDAAQCEALRREILSLMDMLRTGAYTPTILLRDGKPIDFTYRDIMQYGTETAVEKRETFSLLLDEFYTLRERQELSAQRGREISRAATVARDRLVRKAETLRREYVATQDRDRLRLCGDLIMANLYRVERGATELIAENYYAAGQPQVKIALDPRLTPQQNAAKYYKSYRKAKNAEVYLREQIAKAESERSYLESVLQELCQSETEQEFDEIRRELWDTGYLRRGKERKTSKRAFAPRMYRSGTGLRILVGRNNVQNDQLTLKKADRRDIWFHARQIPGSHVILCTNGAEPDEQSLMDAAALAAYFSRAGEGEKVAVDYTPVKNVKKPIGARPGFVVYEMYHTIYVTSTASELPHKLDL